MHTNDELYLDARDVIPSKAFGLLKASVVPRPIAWTSTVSASGPSGFWPSTTIMIVLLELNSLKLAPIRFIATIDGASSGAMGAECCSPTTSSCGASTFTPTATTIQNRTSQPFYRDAVSSRLLRGASTSPPSRAVAGIGHPYGGGATTVVTQLIPNPHPRNTASRPTADGIRSTTPTV